MTRSWRFPRPDALVEVLRFHVALAVLSFAVGYMVPGALASPIPGISGANPAALEVSAPHATGMILANNLGFFLLVSLLPVLNVVTYCVQFFTIGALAQQIHQLPLQAQVDLLYRHTAFEIAALLLSLLVSYAFVLAAHEYVNQPVSDRALLGRRLLAGVRLYPLIFVLTLVGALLEGSAVVHL